jgi:hypothetical protein
MPTGVSQRGRPRTLRAAATSNGSPARARAHEHGYQRDLTVTIPLERAIDVVTAPVAGVGRVLSARNELVRYAGRSALRYAGRGALAAADLMAWPVAAAAGLGHAMVSRWVPRRPPSIKRPTSAAPSGLGGRSTPAARSGPAGRRTSAARSGSAGRRTPAARSRSATGLQPAARPMSGAKRSAQSKPTAAGSTTRRG